MIRLIVTVVCSLLLGNLYGQELLTNVDESSLDDFVYVEPTIEFDVRKTSTDNVVFHTEVSEYTCHCLVSYVNLTGKKHSEGACLYMDTKHTEAFPLNDFKRRRCNEKCTYYAKRLTADQKKKLEECICNSNLNRSVEINAYSHLGDNRRITAHGVGRIEIEPARYDTQCDCSNGWSPEPDNFPGYCSKAVCEPLVKGDRRLYNENGSTWGFIYKGIIYQLKKADCKNVLVSPKVCRLITY